MRAKIGTSFGICCGKGVCAMSEPYRNCPGCGEDRLFERHHAETGSCPDAPDGECPEWICTGCGAALLVGFVADAGAADANAPGRPARAA